MTLPSDAALNTSAGWTIQDELAALTSEVVWLNTIAVLKAAGVKKRIDPLRIPRPWESGGASPKPRARVAGQQVISTLGELQEFVGDKGAK